ncbi:UDP-N-acetylmuramate dehydrogenase [Thomasclavelia ramosa]|uniref:UDP-N-acetylmuramate dehydrogenase n=1 Tax=Thomasclavelia ramosa TaxID=1547 RepID=UPI000E4F56BF|nr:UDP-N-acetylmuramate dehydrogenase [Thomasclavelia ramosa]RGQ39717.1 UDP-N-acetylmuramate dehydrogenase [Thomasclavelia ramosa]RGQ55397.1 UDP-N-acetylmuramate dehydrogenase [Thomasclavelia ramosa]
MKFSQVKEDLEKLDVGEMIEDEPMYKHTTYKVGGPARIYLKVKDVDSLIKTIKYCGKHRVKYLVIGRGSNLLFSDREYEGLIISLNECFNEIKVNGSTMIAQAGVPMISLSYQAAKIGLSGFEFMGGIPGSIGGGIYMNAGAYKYDLASVVKTVTLLNEKHEVVTFNNEQMDFSYRHSICQDNQKLIVLEVTFELTAKSPDEIKAVLDKRKERRMSSQPWNMPSAGSVFRNPQDKPAWQYIDECGLRGYEIGGAQVSPKHSNFIVNNGYASAKDIYDLIMLVQEKVNEKFGVKLRREVGLINWE